MRPAEGNSLGLGRAPWQGGAGFGWLVCAAVAYWATARLGMLLFSLQPANITPLWLASGVGVIMCLEGGVAALPLIVLASAAANYPGMAAGGRPDMLPVFLVAVGDALAAGGMSLLGRIVLPEGVGRVADLFKGVLLVCLPATALSGVLITLVLFTGAYIPHDSAFRLAGMLTAGDTLGVLLVFPLWRAWRVMPAPSFREWWWAGGVLVANLLVVWLSFNGFAGAIHIVVPLLILLALKVRLNGVMTVLVVVMVAVFAAVPRNPGPFMAPSDGETIMLTVSFACSATLVTLGIALYNHLLGQAGAAARMWEHRAGIDPLTGLYNRTRLDDMLETELRRLCRSDAPLSILMLDVDFFKAYNDMYGHVAGDVCLRRVTELMRSIAHRSPDIVARYGGEEFVCVLPGTDESGAYAVAENIRCGVRNLAVPHLGSLVAPYLTVSIGVLTVRSGQGDSQAEILARVDEALYQAKGAGRDRVVMGVPPARDGGVCHSVDVQRLVWNPHYACGEPRIDKSHKLLMERADVVLSSLTQGTSHEEGQAMVEGLLDAVSQHFNEEERVLREMLYPGLEQHASIHKGLIDRATGLVDAYAKGALAPAELLVTLVHGVVMRHMLDDDTLFHPFLHAHEGGMCGAAPVAARS